MGEIKFGTDGWRAVIAEEFTFGNVRLVAQAVADYLKEQGKGENGLIIGYDNRFLSERFAKAAAEVIAGNGIPVWLTVGATPTPVTAFAIKVEKTAGALMITASHNPPEYNGIKFIPDYAGPAVPEITRAIEEKISALQKAEKVRKISLEEARGQRLVRDLDPKPGYLQHLRNLVDLRAISKFKPKIIVDPMWGAGIGYIEELLGGFCREVGVIHGYRDVLFGGTMPEPKAEVLSELREVVVRRNADLGLALDGDADRFGVVDGDGSFITPNEIIYLLLYYLLEYRRWRGPVARTVATTHMVDRIAEDYGLPVVETPVGFKYIGQSLLHHHSILGGEESGGLSVQRHIPEKDGILALALVVEMVAATGKSLREFQAEVMEKYGRLVSARLDLKCGPEEKVRVLEKLEMWSPPEFNGVRVESRITKDGVKFLLADGSWLLVRASGTEPLFRIYVEAPDEEKLRQLQEAARGYLGL
ncbi:MAG TPA: phosphoglucomutase [Peptococcaceae bacterium]|nr:phosphoglucomutase [Peptococcaceae bacterium]